jgi:hypothetical protein
MLTDLMWLVLAYLAFISILLVPLVWLVHALQSCRVTKAGAELRRLAGGPSVP